MALQIQTNLPGGNSDYAKYVSGSPVKTDRVGDVDLFDFSLIPYDAAFVKPIRGTYIRVRTSSFDPWFTGYITNEPELTFLGSLNGQAKYGYNFEASSDEYILNIKPVGIIAPYLNTTQGAIIRSLVSLLDDTDSFNVANVDEGLAVARYVVDPTKTFLTIVQEFCESANYIFSSTDHNIYFQQADAEEAKIVVDGHDKHFNPGKLNAKQTTDPIVNDCTILGGIEPQDYINEYFISDGFTGNFSLLSSVFGVDSTLLLDDDFSNNSVDSSKWTVYDQTPGYLKTDSGYMNCLGGSANGSYDVSLQSQSLIPLEGNLRLTHGQYGFVSASSGVICSLWTGTIGSDFSKCLYGLKASKNGANTVLQPIVNGVVDTTRTLPINYNYRYILRTIVTFQHLFRQQTAYSWMSDGTVSTIGGQVEPTTASIQTYIAEIDPSTGTIIARYIMLATGVTVNPAWAIYSPIVSDDLHLSMSGVTISAPLQASLESKEPGQSSFGMLFIGPNEIDSLDGMAPAATVIDGNNGASTNSSLLGTPQYNPGAASLQFFKDTAAQTTTIPPLRTKMALRYRHAGSAVARVQDTQAVSDESTSWGDSGIRSVLRKDITPSPRTSYECEMAARSIVGHSYLPRFEGTYQQFYPFSFTGEPKAGSILKFQNLPANYPVYLKSETITTVKSTMVSKGASEYFDVEISFGPTDKIRQLLRSFSKQTDVFAPVDTSDIPSVVDTKSVGLSFTSQPTRIDMVSFDVNNFNYHITTPAPSGGGFEVRYTNAGWGCQDGNNLVLRTANQSFSVPRTVRGKTVFVKAYDTRNVCRYSDDLSKFPAASGVNSAVLIHGRTPQGNIGRFSSVYSDNYLDTGIRSQNTSGVWSFSVKGYSGQIVSYSIVAKLDSGDTVTNPTQSLSIACKGGWERHSIPFSFDNTTIGNVVMNVQSTDLSYVCESSIELGRTTESLYCATDGSAYGALSRFAVAVRANLPGVPPAPTATLASIDTAHLLLTFVNPVQMNDVWGYELRDGNNQVLYSSDLSNETYTGTYTVELHGRNVVLNVYSYNLMGEYSAVRQLSLNMPTPSLGQVVINDHSKLLQWDSTNCTGFILKIDTQDSSFTHLVVNQMLSANFFQLSDADFFGERWIQITPFDAIGTGSAVVAEHSYLPDPVYSLDGDEVAVIVNPVTSSGAPVISVPAGFERYATDYTNVALTNYRLNVGR